MITAPPLRALALGSYFNRDAMAVAKANKSWEPRNFNRIVFAVKDHGKAMNGYTKKQAGGKEWRIASDQSDPANLAAALGLCAALYADADVLPEVLGVVAPFVVVPVPSREALVGVENPSRWGPKRLAAALNIGPVLDLIRFQSAPLPAKEGGPRHWNELKPMMTLVGSRPNDCTSAIIVDDVVSTGGHMQAVAALLKDAGFISFGGICIGVNVSAPVDDPWQSRTIELGPWGREDAPEAPLEPVEE